MAFGTNNIILPGKGVVGFAPPHTEPPDKATFNPTGDNQGWTFFHSSRENNVKFSKDGGDTTKYGSWWESNLLAIHDDETWTLDIAALQWDLDMLRAAWPGGRVTPKGGYAIANGSSAERACYVFAMNGLKRFAAYCPRLDTSSGDMPEFALDALLELNLKGTTLGATTEGDEANLGDTIIWYPPAALTAPAGP